MKTVLVPVDGSDCSLQAVRYLIDARAGGVVPRVHLVNVQPALRGDISQFVEAADIRGFQAERSEAALRTAREQLAAAGCAVELHAEVGAVAECIVQKAEALGCDHIVMGSHGRGALNDLLAGSTTVRVIHLTRLPVVVVK